MSNKSFWGKLASKNKKSAHDISKDTGIPEDKVKEVLSGDRKLPTKHVDAVVKSIQTKDNSLRKVDYLNAKKFFRDNKFSDLRTKFGYGTQRSLASAIRIPACYVSNFESNQIDLVPNYAVLKAYDFFQDELNIRTTPIVAKKGGRKKKNTSSKYTRYNKSSISIGNHVYAHTNGTTTVTNTTNNPYTLTFSSLSYDYSSLPKDFNASTLFEVLKHCEASSVVELYKLLDSFINEKE